MVAGFLSAAGSGATRKRWKEFCCAMTHWRLLLPAVLRGAASAAVLKPTEHQTPAAPGHDAPAQCCRTTCASAIPPVESALRPEPRGPRSRLPSASGFFYAPSVAPDLLSPEPAGLPGTSCLPRPARR